MIEAMHDAERETVIARLLELAAEAERLSKLAREERHYGIADHQRGLAAAYYSAARLLGWREAGPV